MMREMKGSSDTSEPVMSSYFHGWLTFDRSSLEYSPLSQNIMRTCGSHYGNTSAAQAQPHISFRLFDRM